MKTRSLLRFILRNPALPMVALAATLLGPQNIEAADARFIQVIKNENPDTRFHLGELEAFEDGVVPDDLGGGSFGGLTTSTNDIGNGTLTAFNVGAILPDVGTMAALEHGGGNTNPNNAMEAGGAVWSTANGQGTNAQYTLDLGGTFDVTTVRMWPRADGCCANRWQNLEVNLIADDGTGQPGGVVASSTDPMLAAPGGNVPLELTFDSGLDADGDGLSNSYEDANGLDKNDDGTVGESAPGLKDGPNGAAGDKDGDGISNIEERNQGSHPNDDDTDDDGLLDGVEDGGGVYVNDTQTGTSPTNPDSDDDGLNDNVETNTGNFVDADDTGTDPNNPDSDGDFVDDGDEIAEGFDPTDPNSKPARTVIVDLGVGTDALIGGDLTDPEDDGVQDINPANDDWSSLNWNWVTIEASSENYFGPAGGSEGAYDVFDNEVGSGQTKWCCGGPPQWITVEFEQAISLSSFTVTSGNDVPGRDPLQWNISGSNDNVTFEPIFEQDDPVSLWPQRLQVLHFILPKPSSAYKFIRYEVTQTGANHQINEIEYFGTTTEPTFFFQVEASGDDLVLTWDSEAGNLYDVLSDLDLDPEIEAWPVWNANEMIAATPPRNTLTIPRPADPERYFAIKCYPTPPEKAYSEDFESGQGAWTTTSEDAVGTEWELGTPDGALFGGPPAANSGTNCFGTDLDANYVEDTLIRLRSPGIDLSTVAVATGNAEVIYWQWKDIEVMFDKGTVRLLDAADLSEIAILADDIEGSSTAWEEVRHNLPPEADGKTVILEFVLDSDNFGNQAGWSLDDICIEGPGL